MELGTHVGTMSCIVNSVTVLALAPICHHVQTIGCLPTSARV